jgi:hypothetical protein
MGLTGDRYVSTYQGHTIELLRNNWIKTLKLLIDGKVVSSSSQILPHDVTLTGALEHGGIRHSVVVRSMIHFPWTEDVVELDGMPLTLTKTK